MGLGCGDLRSERLTHSVMHQEDNLTASGDHKKVFHKANGYLSVV